MPTEYDLATRDRHVRRDGDAYGTQLLTYLPQGQAWPREPGSTLVNTLTGLAYTYGFVDSRAADLLERDSDPRLTTDAEWSAGWPQPNSPARPDGLLDEWERAWGLPDPCFPPGVRIEESFGDNILIGAWSTVGGADVSGAGDYIALTEDGTDGTHFVKQQFVALDKDEYRVSIKWRPITGVGKAPRGLMFSIESFDSGANIWINADGTLNVAETINWGTGVAISAPKSTRAGDDWLIEYTIDVSIANKFDTCGLYLVSDDTSYQGLDNGTGIEFRNASLTTVTRTEIPIAQTVAQRQKMLVLYMTWLGGQSRAYFIGLMEYLGFTGLEVKEWAPFMAGVSSVGDTRPIKLNDNNSPIIVDGDTFITDTSKQFRWYIGPPEMRFYWSMNVGMVSVSWFRASSGQAGVDPHMRMGAPDDLQCLLNRWRPAHTQLVYDFSSSPATYDPMYGTP